jgi:oligopeptidase A
VRHLNAVVSTAELRDAYNGNLPKVTAFYTDLAQDPLLFARYRALAASRAFASLDAAKKKFIENELRDFRLGGAELPDEQKRRFKAVRKSSPTCRRNSTTTLLDATNAWC